MTDCSSAVSFHCLTRNLLTHAVRFWRARQILFAFCCFGWVRFSPVRSPLRLFDTQLAVPCPACFFFISSARVVLALSLSLIKPSFVPCVILFRRLFLSFSSAHIFSALLSLRPCSVLRSCSHCRCALVLHALVSHCVSLCVLGAPSVPAQAARHSKARLSGLRRGVKRESATDRGRGAQRET